MVIAEETKVEKETSVNDIKAMLWDLEVYIQTLRQKQALLNQQLVIRNEKAKL